MFINKSSIKIIYKNSFNPSTNIPDKKKIVTLNLSSMLFHDWITNLFTEVLQKHHL